MSAYAPPVLPSNEGVSMNNGLNTLLTVVAAILLILLVVWVFQSL